MAAPFLPFYYLRHLFYDVLDNVRQILTIRLFAPMALEKSEIV